MVRGGPLFLIALLAAAHANAGTLWVAFPANGEPCSYEQLAAALRARLGEVSVQPGVPATPNGDVAVAVGRSGRDWALRVRAAGERELERELPDPGADCVATTETAALMIERYLDDINWSGGGAVVQKLPPPPPKPARAPWQLVVEAAGAGELLLPSSGASPMGGGGGVLEVGVRWRNWQAELSGGLSQLAQQTLSSSTFLKGGVETAETLALQLAPLELGVGRRFPIRFGAFRLELAAGVELLWASTNLFQSNSAFAALPSLALRGGYELPLWRRLFLAIRVEARVHQADELTGQGLSSVSTGDFDGEATLGLGYAFF